MKNTSSFYISAQHLEEKFKELSLEEISQSAGLFQRTGRKLTVSYLLMSFYMSVFVSRAMFSFSHWALQASLLFQGRVSKQAIAKRVNSHQYNFAQMLLGRSLAYQVQKASLGKSDPTLFASFKRVLLHDSTVLKVPNNLAHIFKGTRANGGSTASARLPRGGPQHVYELKSEQNIAFELTSYTVNDQAASACILPLLEAADLIIRDLGYFVLPVFRQIQENQAFYLSRFKFNTNVYDLHQDIRIDLCQVLSKHQSLDMYCRLGGGQKLITRIVAVKLPEHIVEQRRRKLIKKSITDQGKKYGKQYTFLLGWAIFITNVDTKTWTPGQIMQAYGLRWRIESVFKCWKSHFHLTDLCTKGKMSEAMVGIFIFYILAFITLFWVTTYHYWFDKVFQSPGKYLSIFKFTDVAMTCGVIQDEAYLLEIYSKFAVYDKHNKRYNHAQALEENLEMNSYEVLFS